MAGNGTMEAVARVAERRYWRAADARIVVEAWRASGEGLGAFSERYGIHPRRVSRWAGQLGSEAEEAVVFHPVRLVAAALPAEPRAPIEIMLGDGCSVRVPAGFAAGDLERVLWVLAGAGAGAGGC